MQKSTANKKPYPYAVNFFSLLSQHYLSNINSALTKPSIKLSLFQTHSHLLLLQLSHSMHLPPFLSHNSFGWCQFWFMVILVLSFYHLGIVYFLAPFLGIWFSRLSWRIWIVFYFRCWTNLDPFLFPMLDEFGSFSISDVGRFFKYEEFQSNLFQVSILFDWYRLKFILKLV